MNGEEERSVAFKKLIISSKFALGKKTRPLVMGMKNIPHLLKLAIILYAYLPISLHIFSQIALVWVG